MALNSLLPFRITITDCWFCRWLLPCNAAQVIERKHRLEHSMRSRSVWSTAYHVVQLHGHCSIMFRGWWWWWCSHPRFKKPWYVLSARGISRWSLRISRNYRWITGSHQIMTVAKVFGCCLMILLELLFQVSVPVILDIIVCSLWQVWSYSCPPFHIYVYISTSTFDVLNSSKDPGKFIHTSVWI